MYLSECTVPGNFLNEGVYFVGLAISSFEKGTKIHFWEQNIISFNVKDMIENVKTRKHGYTGAIPGIIRPILKWKNEKLR